MGHSDLSVNLEERLVCNANLRKIPLTVNFEITPICNLNCDMCFIHTSKTKMQELGGCIQLEDWLRIAKSFKKAGSLFVLLTGGEPLLYPKFEELYTSLKKMGFIITINTNGTLITEKVAQLFYRLKPRRVNVTLYGTNEKTYFDLSHNINGYSLCIRGLELLKKYNIDTKLNISAVKKNISDYDSFFTLASKLKIPVEVNSYMFPYRRSSCDEIRHIEKERLDPETAAHANVHYLKYKKNYEYSKYVQKVIKCFECGATDNLPLSLDCRAGKSSCWINWQGNMSPCVALEEPSISLRKCSVDEAWKYIVEESQKLETHTECAGCKLRAICDVCYAAALHEKKALGNLNYLCEMAQWKKKYLLEE